MFELRVKILKAKLAFFLFLFLFVCFVKAQNLIKNGDFSQGLDYWITESRSFYTCGYWDTSNNYLEQASCRWNWRKTYQEVDLAGIRKNKMEFSFYGKAEISSRGTCIPCGCSGRCGKIGVYLYYYDINNNYLGKTLFYWYFYGVEESCCESSTFNLIYLDETNWKTWRWVVSDIIPSGVSLNDIEKIKVLINTYTGSYRKTIAYIDNIFLGETCRENQEVCELNEECCSSYCKEDYDGSGKWCADSTQCVHNGIIYNSGECSEAYVCDNGNWVEHCFDNVQNCDEEGVDCGGAYCEACLPEDVYLISPGWNLISIPAKGIGSIISDECKVFSEFYYYNSSTKKYQKVLWNELEGGKGYWLYSPFSEECSVKVSAYGEVVASDIKLKAGYNLIGSLKNYYSVDDIKGDCVIEEGPYTWDNGWRLSNLLKPKKGYWIKVSDDCEFG